MNRNYNAQLKAWGDSAAGPANAAYGAELLRRVIDVVGRERGIVKVCDLGCGNGLLAHLLAERGYEVTGVDASDTLLSIAREHHTAKDVVFHNAVLGEDDLQPIIANGPFDAAVSVDVIEHLYRPGALIEAAHQIVKPGGVFIVCTPYHGYLKNLAITALGRWDDHHHVHFDGGHIKFFSVRTLRHALEPRFQVEMFDYAGRFPGFWKNMICIARKPR